MRNNIKFERIFEIGVYQGYSTCYFSTIANNVYSFEPLKEMFPIIKRNLELNKISNVKLTNCAVSDYNGKANFYRYSIKGWSSLIQHEACDLDNVSETEVITMDKFCDEEKISHIDILSIDAEGNEINVLKGCERILRNKSADIIFFEIAKEYVSNEQISSIFDLLNTNGYKIIDLEFNRVEDIDNLSFQQDLVAISPCCPYIKQIIY